MEKELIGCGYSNRNIAKVLVISKHTVNDYTKRSIASWMEYTVTIACGAQTVDSVKRFFLNNKYASLLQTEAAALH